MAPIRVLTEDPCPLGSPENVDLSSCGKSLTHIHVPTIWSMDSGPCVRMLIDIALDGSLLWPTGYVPVHGVSRNGAPLALLSQVVSYD